MASRDEVRDLRKNRRQATMQFVKALGFEPKDIRRVQIGPGPQITVWQQIVANGERLQREVVLAFDESDLDLDETVEHIMSDAPVGTFGQKL